MYSNSRKRSLQHHQFDAQPDACVVMRQNRRGIPGLLLSSVIPAETGGSLDNLNLGTPVIIFIFEKVLSGLTIPNYINRWSNSIGMMNQKGQIKQKKIQLPEDNVSKYHLSNKSEMVTHLVMDIRLGSQIFVFQFNTH